MYPDVSPLTECLYPFLPCRPSPRVSDHFSSYYLHSETLLGSISCPHVSSAVSCLRSRIRPSSDRLKGKHKEISSTVPFTPSYRLVSLPCHLRLSTNRMFTTYSMDVQCTWGDFHQPDLGGTSIRSDVVMSSKTQCVRYVTFSLRCKLVKVFLILTTSHDRTLLRYYTG